MRKLGDLKVPELHDELAKVGLSKKGKKAELVERLTEYIREQGSEPDEIDFDVADVLVDMKNSSGAMESEAETKTTINQIEDVDNGDARGGGEVVEAKEFVLTKPDSKDEQREDDEVQVIHQTDEPIPEDEKLKIEEMYPTSEPMDGFDGPIMINSSQSSQESNNTTITSTDEGEESMEIETKVPDIDVQAEKPTSRKASDNETEEVVAEKEKLQAEEPKAKESTEKEPEVPQEEKKDGDSPEHSSKEIQPKEPVEMEVETTHSDPGTVLLTGFSGQRQVNYWGTQVPPIRSDTESSGFQSEARPLTPDPSENSGDDGDDEWAIDENNNCYDDSADYRNASSEESSDCESTASEDEILERINYMEAENMEPFLS